MKKCGLCGSKKARMYCESDQASLCWKCDAEVHSANFLVAKHSRCLLCDVCQSQTPWTASGEMIGPTISVCIGCLDAKSKKTETDRRRDDADGCCVDDDDENADDSCEEEEEEETKEEEGENQVVPWSSDYSPPATSSSISGEESSADCAGNGRLAPKRNWNDAFLDSDKCEVDCASSSQGRADTISPASSNQLKHRRVLIKEEKDASVAE